MSVCVCVCVLLSVIRLVIELHVKVHHIFECCSHPHREKKQQKFTLHIMCGWEMKGGKCWGSRCTTFVGQQLYCLVFFLSMTTNCNSICFFFFAIQNSAKRAVFLLYYIISTRSHTYTRQVSKYINRNSKHLDSYQYRVFVVGFCVCVRARVCKKVYSMFPLCKNRKNVFVQTKVHRHILDE